MLCTTFSFRSVFQRQLCIFSYDWISFKTDFASGNMAVVGPSLLNRAHLDLLPNNVIIHHPNRPIHLEDDYQVDQFRFFAKRKGALCLQIWRPEQSNDYRLVATTRKYGANFVGIHNVTLSSETTIRDGDVIGFYSYSLGVIPYDAIEYAGKHTLYIPMQNTRDLVEDKVVPFSEALITPCRNYSVHLTMKTPDQDKGQFQYQRPLFKEMRWIRVSKVRAVKGIDRPPVPAQSRIVSAATCMTQIGCRSFTFSGKSDTCWLGKDKRDNSNGNQIEK